MRFLIDENIGEKVVQFLNQQGYSTNHVTEIQIGIEDYQILDLSYLRDSIVITFDKDFGRLVFKEGKAHKGVIFLRLDDQTSSNTIRALQTVLLDKSKIENYFTVITEKEGKYKIRKTKRV